MPPMINHQFILVLNKPQFLSHIPPPRISSSSLRWLRFTLVKGVATGLESLEEHACIKEAV